MKDQIQLVQIDHLDFLNIQQTFISHDEGEGILLCKEIDTNDIVLIVNHAPIHEHFVRASLYESGACEHIEFRDNQNLTGPTYHTYTSTGPEFTVVVYECFSLFLPPLVKRITVNQSQQTATVEYVGPSVLDKLKSASV